MANYYENHLRLEGSEVAGDDLERFYNAIKNVAWPGYVDKSQTDDFGHVVDLAFRTAHSIPTTIYNEIHKHVLCHAGSPRAITATATFSGDFDFYDTLYECQFADCTCKVIEDDRTFSKEEKS